MCQKMTSSENTKRALIEVLKGKTSSVIALSGRWGTGKTYLWKEVEKTLLASHAETADPVYISLFGVKTIAELKLRIIQAAAIKGGPLFQTFQKGTGSILKGIAGKFLPGSALDDVILLSVPTLIKGRLVVIDDVERKHKTLDIDEVLGFLNEYAENYSTRFILLLNTDKLADQSTWETLHEKVIDIEIVLDPTVAEAFDVAIKGVAFEYIEKIRDALNILGITNIRIIRRVIRVVVRLLGKTATLDDSLLGRTIPSTVLLTCIHYRAAIAGLTTEYVTTHNSFSKAFAQNERSSEEIEWDELLQKLNIRGTDEYEDLVIRYLQKGLLDDAKVTAVLNTYRKSATENAVQSRLDAFTRDFFWDSTLDPQLALENARSFLNDISILNVVAISNLSDMVSEIGDRELSVLLIDRWIDNFRATPQLEVTENSFEYQHQKISPVILEALRKLKASFSY